MGIMEIMALIVCLIGLIFIALAVVMLIYFVRKIRSKS